MASYTKRGNSWRVQVKRGNARKTRTFETKAAARTWATQEEAEILAGERGEIPNKTFGELLQHYADTVSLNKKGWRWERVRIEAFKRDPVALVKLADLRPTHIAEWRDRRLKTVSGSTVVREWNLMSAAINTAKREWGWLKESPMRPVARPKESKPRSRRPTDDELERLSLALGYDPDRPPIKKSARVGATMWFAIETAMRAGEIADLKHSDIEGKVARLRDTKNGSDRNVPLSSEALRIIEQMPDQGGSIFGLSSSQISSLFRIAKGRALIGDLTFHDMRREGTTRLAKKLDVMTLAKVTGHKDLRILQAVYYEPDMGEVAELLD